MIVLMPVESKVHGESQKCKFTSVASLNAQALNNCTVLSQSGPKRVQVFSDYKSIDKSIPVRFEGL